MDNNLCENIVKIETPVEKAVRSTARSALSILSASLITLTVLIVSAFEFTYAITLLPLILFDLIVTCISFSASKSQSIRCVLNLKKTASLLALVFTIASFTLDYLSSYSYIDFYAPLYGIAQNFRFPFNLLNTGFLPTMFLLPLAVLYSAKLISICSLSRCVKTNLPKRGLQIVAAILSLLAFLSFVQDSLSRMYLFLPQYLYCGPETHNTIIMYTTGAVCLLAAVAALLEAINCFKNFSKLRKIENAF